MSQQSRRARRVKLGSSWNLLLDACGLVFAGIGVATIFFGFDAASKIIGIAIVALGAYFLLLGVRRGVVVDQSGIVVRSGVRSSEPIPWPSVGTIEVEETRLPIVRLCVPNVVVRGSAAGEPVPLRPLAYYRLTGSRRSRQVDRLSSLVSEHRRD
ncbi:hypothetical protein ACFVYA_04935 [Amycolatopsis sp. NPDC058278]|uniref:hypothetical protein n=1 Tax=Amycolatopsis sp. NPDC058278 TaxID=3346417 RepID=UPI0036DB17F4